MSVPNNDPKPDRGACFFEAPLPQRTAADHAEVAAALARFQARLACTPYLKRPWVGRVSAACALLTIAAFAGGLALSRFSFNPPPRAASILAPSSDVLYFQPPNPAAAFANLRSGAALASAAGLTLPGEARHGVESWLAPTESAVPPQEDSPGETRVFSEGGDLNFHELGRSWGEAVHVANGLRPTSSSTQAEPVQ